jgi:hypothetical protein
LAGIEKPDMIEASGVDHIVLHVSDVSVPGSSTPSGSA